MTRIAGVLVVWVTLVAWAGPAAAQIGSTTTRAPTTTRPIIVTTTAPPDTEPPPETTAVTAPVTTRARASTTAPRGTTSTTAGTTTTHTLLPPPSVAPQDPGAPPTGSTQSDRISSVFYVLSILGFVTAIALLSAQWFLTRPGRRGWTL
ncbi:MAG: hypothetical protein QOE35_2269 [Actinomycetota bacterium]